METGTKDFPTPSPGVLHVVCAMARLAAAPTLVWVTTLRTGGLVMLAIKAKPNDAGIMATLRPESGLKTISA